MPRTSCSTFSGHRPSSWVVGEELNSKGHSRARHLPSPRVVGTCRCRQPIVPTVLGFSTTSDARWGCAAVRALSPVPLESGHLIHVTRPLFPWSGLKHPPPGKPSASSYALPDQDLPDGLQQAHGRGRHGSPARVLWGTPVPAVPPRLVQRLPGRPAPQAHPLRPARPATGRPGQGSGDGECRPLDPPPLPFGRGVVEGEQEAIDPGQQRGKHVVGNAGGQSVGRSTGGGDGRARRAELGRQAGRSDPGSDRPAAGSQDGSEEGGTREGAERGSRTAVRAGSHWPNRRVGCENDMASPYVTRRMG